MKSRTFLLLTVAILLIIAFTAIQATAESTPCSTCEDVRIPASDPNCIEWIWVEVDEDGNPKDPGVTVSSGGGTSNAGGTTKTTVEEEDKDGGLQKQETDNSWWWKVLVALGSCVIGLTCIVGVVGFVVAVWWKRQHRVQEYSLYQGAFKSSNKKNMANVIEATDQDFTNADDVSEYDSDEYEDDDEDALLDDEEDNVNMGHDQVPAASTMLDEADDTMMDDDQVDSDGFESDEYDD